MHARHLKINLKIRIVKGKKKKMENMENYLNWYIVRRISYEINYSDSGLFIYVKNDSALNICHYV